MLIRYFSLDSEKVVQPIKTVVRFSTVKSFYFTRLPRVNLYMYSIKLIITYLRLYQGDKQGDIKTICPGDIVFCPAAKTKMASDCKSVVKKQNTL